MGTKTVPGAFDCYAKAEPDEPMFVLLGRDPAACAAVLFWIQLARHVLGTPQEKLDEARACALAMGKWTVTHGKHNEFDQVCTFFEGFKRDAKWHKRHKRWWQFWR